MTMRGLTGVTRVAMTDPLAVNLGASATQRLPLMAGLSGHAATLAAIVVSVLLASAAAGAYNQIAEADIDARMLRTRTRPFANGTFRPGLVWYVAVGALLAVAIALSVAAANWIAATFTFLGAFTYGVVYTIWLKRRTALNIVVGGFAGSFAVLAGAAAAAPTLPAEVLLFALAMFFWTPPHFWALAIARRDEYAKVGIPMLPVTHGIAYTRLQILLYTILMVLVSLLPYLTGMCGFIYLGAALLLNARFVYLAIALQSGTRPELPMLTFKYSITYLMALFAALIVDHFFLFKV